jgi:hypothetical protein
MYSRHSSGFLLIIICFLAIFFSGLFIIRQLGSTYYSAGAILLSAILALCGALINVFYQRRTARESNSLAFQQSLSDNETYNKNIPIIIKAIKNRYAVPLRDYTKPENSTCSQATAIRHVLNTWERSANAMRHGIYDEQYLYEAHKSMVLHLGVYLRGFINEKQREQASFYENFSWLVLNWTIRRDGFEELATKNELKRIFMELNAVKAGKLPKSKGKRVH